MDPTRPRHLVSAAAAFGLAALVVAVEAPAASAATPARIEAPGAFCTHSRCLGRPASGGSEAAGFALAALASVALGRRGRGASRPSGD